MLDTQRAVGEIGEKELLRYLHSRIPQGPGVRVGIGDDAAVVETSASTLVTTDSLVEGVHFTREWSPPRLLGRKALSVNLSDAAAMGGVGRHAVVSLFLPAALPLSFVDELYDGLLERAAETGVNIVGGNVSATSRGRCCGPEGAPATASL
jgi:thiamine-monophosphate kinase